MTTVHKLLLTLLLSGFFLGCSSNDSITIDTKGKTVTVKVKTTNGWSVSGVVTKKIQLKEGWAILTTKDCRVLIYPSESLIDVIVPKG